jgi:hypothetical protein
MATVKQSVVEPNLVLPTFNFSPISGPLGTEVTLSGSALTSPVSQVLFNGTPASRYIDPNTGQLIAIVPAGATDGPITLTFANGGSLTNLGSFDVTPGIANPKIRNFFPTSGAPGALVQLDGSGFTQAGSVLFGNVPATQFNIQADTNIIVVVPAGAQDGPIKVVRGTAIGVSNGNFDVTGTSLAINGFSPTSGVSGQQVNITGAGFLGVDTVLFGGLSALFTISGDGLITATAPAGLPGTAVNIVVRKAGVQAISQGLFTYTANAGTSITSFSPISGPVNTSVNIFGNNLQGVDVVRFGGVATNFAIISNSQLIATVPAGALDGFITVEDNGVFAQSSTIFDVQENALFSVNGISPASGPAGTNVTISGVGLIGVDSVFFGTQSASFSILNGNTLVASAPAGAAGTTVVVTVRKAGQVASGSLLYTYTGTASGSLTITSIAPNPAFVGNTVRILGSGFNSVVQLRIGRMLVPFSVINDREIRFTAASGQFGRVILISGTTSVAFPTNFSVQ